MKPRSWSRGKTERLGNTAKYIPLTGVYIVKFLTPRGVFTGEQGNGGREPGTPRILMKMSFLWKSINIMNSRGTKPLISG